MVFLAGAVRAADKPTYDFVTAAGVPYVKDQGSDGFLDLLLRTAFGRLSRSATVTQMPGERALVNANNGIDDGDALRVAGMERIYPDLIQVPASVHSMEFVAITLRGRDAIGSWEDLSGLSVGIIRGWKIFEKRLADHLGVTTVRNAGQLFDILGQERVDVVLLETWQAAPFLKRLHLTATVHQPPLVAMPMFVYLNSAHADLVPRLTEIFESMAADGSLEAIRERAFKEWATYVVS